VADARGHVTRLLGEIRSGEHGREAELAHLVYRELHDIARRLMRHERADHTLQATALVHEAFIRLLGDGQQDWDSRRHFFAVAATAMRRILVDHARGRAADKRGGDWQRVDLDEPAVVGRDDLDQVIAIDEALTRLAGWDARQARIVELRFFVGLSEEEIAQLLDVSVRTVKRDWRLARAWLHAELSAPRAGEPVPTRRRSGVSV
jgi:RNA polymerase sigma factor (TIGR02999 family)